MREREMKIEELEAQLADLKIQVLAAPLPSHLLGG